jgi:hypothetical protein
MSLTLKEAITATQTTVDVNGTDTLSNGDLYAIEDEQVYIVAAGDGSIQPGQTPWQRLSVQRGQLGTTEASHVAGTAMTVVETPLGASGVQAIRLLKATLNFNDPNVENDAVGIVLAESLVINTVVIEVWAELKTRWVGPTAAYLRIDALPAYDALITPEPDLTKASLVDTVQTMAYNNQNVDITTSVTTLTGTRSHSATDPWTPKVRVLPARVAVTGASIISYIIRAGSAASAGQADVYALIAEPA